MSDGRVLVLKDGKIKALGDIPGNPLISSFGRIKVSDSFNIFEAVFNFDKLPLVFDESLVTGGTNTFNSTKGAIDMAVTTASGSSVTVQSRKRIRYNPARSVIVQIAANIGGDKANVRRRVGQFDANNGVYFELDGLTKNVVIRNNNSGSIVNTVIPQSSWNIDKLDGTGSSGLTLDLSKQQLFVIEYGWQGVASVRFGVYINGSVVFCHAYETGNTLSLSFMKTANLPVRMEITNTGASASATTMSCNCIVVKNDGNDSEQEGLSKAYIRSTVKTVSTIPTFTPVLAFRLNSTRLEGIIEFLKMAVYCSTADDIAYGVYLNPTLTGATFAVTNSYLDIDLAATALSGGTLIETGFAKQAEQTGSASFDVMRFINSQFGVSLAGVSDVICLAASSRVGTADVLASAVWREF